MTSHLYLSNPPRPMRIANYTLVTILLLMLFSCTVEYQPIDDAEIVVRISSEPAKLSALYAAGRAEDSRIASQIYQPLLEFDPETLEIVPVAAAARPVITAITDGLYAGGTKHEYIIRPEAIWGDGQPVLAADFLFALKAIVSPKSGLQRIAPHIDFVKSVEIDPSDPKRFTAYTDSKYIKAEMSLGNMPVMPKHILDPNGVLDRYTLADLRDPATLTGPDSTRLIDIGELISSDEYNRDPSKLVASGAYTLESWASGSQIVLRRKENWWGNRLQEENNVLESRPRKITYMLVKDEPAAITMLKDGQLDAMSGINPTAFVQLRENELAKNNLTLSTPQVFQYYFVALNMDNPKLADVKVRKALAHLVDYQGLINNVLYGMGERIVGPLHPSHYAYNENLVLPEFDIDKAVFLLEEAGWNDTNGDGIRDKVINGKKTELTLNLLASPSENSKNICLFLQSTAAKIGVNIVPEFKDLRSFLPKEVIPGAYDMFALAWSQSPGEYDPKLLWHTASMKGGRNWVGYGNEATDKVIDDLRNEMDDDKRLALYHRWQSDVVAAQPYLFLCAPQERIGIQKKYDAPVSARRPGLFENLFQTSDAISGQ